MIKPFQIDQTDIDRSSTLEQSDLGQWAILIQGCYQFVASAELVDLS